MKHCASCHGPDGRARTPIARKLGVKDLAESQLEEADIERQIVEGARDPQGNLRMPPFKEKTTAEELKLLIAHVKSLRKN